MTRDTRLDTLCSCRPIRTSHLFAHTTVSTTQKRALSSTLSAITLPSDATDSDTERHYSRAIALNKSQSRSPVPVASQITYQSNTSMTSTVSLQMQHSMDAPLILRNRSGKTETFWPASTLRSHVDRPSPSPLREPHHSLSVFQCAARNI